MEQSESKLLREQLVAAMGGGQAHVDIRSALKDFPEQLRGAELPGSPHTAWQLLEHLRIAQWDILEFSKDARHKSPKWPDEYWPTEAAPPHPGDWDKAVAAFERDHAEMGELISNSKSDLFAALPHGTGQTLLREALLIGNHNSYHLGQLLLLRKTLEK